MKYFKIILLLFSTIAFSQDYKTLWSETIQDELDGKKESAYKKVQNIYSLAKRENNEVQIIKCFFYTSKFRQTFDEKSQENIISDLKEEITKAQPISKAILNFIYGDILTDFLNYYFYKIQQNTPTQNTANAIISTWSTVDFTNEINKCFQESVSNASLLYQTPIADYKEILEIPAYVDGKNYSLYELLHNEISKNYIQIFNNYQLKKDLPFTADQTEKLYTNTTQFTKVSDATYSSLFNSFLKQLQDREILISKNNPKQLDQTIYKRLTTINNLFNIPKSMNEALSLLKKETKDKTLYNQLLLGEIKQQILYSNKTKNPNGLKEIVKQLDEIIQQNPDEYTVTEALLEKEKILDKTLSIKINKINYEGENHRALVNFKNIDALQISYFKVPTKDYLNLQKFNNDSAEIGNILKNKKPYLTSTKVLPNSKTHFTYSTEILLENLPLGHYIIKFEDTDNLSNTQIDCNYSFYHVTNISYVEDESEDYDLFFIHNRKTGKPLDNAYLQTKEKRIQADKNGKIAHPKTSKNLKEYLSEAFIITDKDTLAFNYHPSLKDRSDNDDEDDFAAKAMVYFDRAIYRPGQKVYYKGIIFQNKNNKKSIVPFVTAHVKIENASYEIIKEFEVQTNEFGSFSGEFDLPKNCMSGDFSMTIEEPDGEFFPNDKKYYNKKEKEHSFWDNVDFDEDDFKFKVEEYKRPTFEVTTEKLKNIFSLGEKVELKGSAKTFAGSNLTNASVRYSISRNYATENHGYTNDANFIQKEIKTDSEGNFNIPLDLNIENLKDDKLHTISFTITIDVTDISGETRSINRSLTVRKENLMINSRLAPILYEEDSKNINIEITNLDTTPQPYPGKIQIFRKEIKRYLKPRAFETPEIANFTEEEFKKLFPYEPYKDNQVLELTKIDSIAFDTHNGNEINLPNLKKGFYKTIVSIVDTKGNSIEKEHHFEIKSKNNPSIENKVFTFKRIQHQDEKQIHFEINTSLKELYVTTRFYVGNKLTDQKVTSLENGKGIVSFKKQENPKYDYAFFFSTQWENNGYSQDIILTKEAKTRKIEFEVVSFRNKIEPGSKEKWSLKITDNKLETEVLASMYDSSLDVFAKNNWGKPNFYKYGRYADFPNIRDYNTESLYFSTRTKKIYYQKITFEPRFEWFGFNYNNPKNQFIQKQYEQNVAQPQIIRPGTKTVTGIVSDSSGPLPGANVAIKGTQIRVSTGFNGSYSINAKEGEILVYSFLGMKDISKVVGSANIINTILQDESKKLGEVVVTAFGIKKESNTVNPNVIFVSNKDLNKDDFFMYKKSLTNALAGKVSGLHIASAEGATGSSSQIIIRGASSVNGENKALIIIDGEIAENLDPKDIKPEDITSITILKDKEATALYGTKGANGVIIITTQNALKQLSKVKTRTNFNETAFFYPHLTTDNKGKVSFSFTTPESLTKWKLRLLGHDKNADLGTFETEIISQKDVMVMPNTPRFLRETDTITLATKIVNLTSEVKSGTALLQLFDAVTGNPIDVNCGNINSIKTFNCKAKESVAVDWVITVPEGTQAIQYKIVAKSGSFSDGEENMIPVLSNKILVTESLPIWVRENSKKEFVFENLKNNTSKTLKHQSFTFEYTSNPTWLAIQSLPYLMEYEHECAEQTFSRLYANTIASKIIEGQPKIAEVFEKWRNEPNKKSKIEMNEELKSIVLRETPWLFDTDETEKNRRVASLFALDKLKESNESALQKLKEKQQDNGGFSWFAGGQTNYHITQHILSGLGHLTKMFPSNNYNSITAKGIPFIDNYFIENTNKQRKNKREISSTELQYLYCRSFYTKEHIVNDTLKKAINYQIQQTKTNWLHLSLGEKAMLAITAKRFGDSLYAKKIITHLKETAIKDDEKGMFWIENNYGYYWFEAPIENQALLIEAFAEIENDQSIINNLKAWLIHQKQREHWGTTKATTEAIYALLSHNGLIPEQKNESIYSIGNKELLQHKLTNSGTEVNSDYFKIQWKSDEIKSDLATITIENKSNLPNFGGVYWQYFEELDKINSSKNPVINISKEVFKKVKDTNGEKLIPLKESSIAIGDKITIRLLITSNVDLEFVHLKDLRASCLEPLDVISKYKSHGDLWYYLSSKDTATHFFFDQITQGTHIIEYDLRVNNTGAFNNGIATIQSMYAPEFNGNSTSQKINVN
ncbi:alpha-2-macroglobulin family protein [Flavobacterium oreochromis]|uniref:Alpha-2-macroglobulin domain-containing protein n=1 Tax=Flavobacterium columnare TaxID=996 RepID=A0A246G832_9FLAO|nr:alpha-2-macroglobulin family protein [Flavobacterium oreochromis]OWP74884.1 hypothetical protein BWK62_13215 [Flavobacterium oreochromis]